MFKIEEKITDLKKILLVPLADTVVDPGTVVVHPQDAAAANATVVSSRRSIHLTPDDNNKCFTDFEK